LEEWGEAEFRTWLTSIGLPSLIPVFEKAGIQMAQLVNLAETQLQDIGINRLGHRKKLKREAEKVVERSTSSGNFYFPFLVFF